MATRVETLIIGGGQAGLTLSHHLTEQRRPHVLLDRGRIGERWRTERWDSFRLLTPNWQTGLPGMGYHGDDPDGFMDRAAVVDLFERYARSIGAPVRTGVAVHGVRRTGRTWCVTSDHGAFTAVDELMEVAGIGEATLAEVAPFVTL